MTMYTECAWVRVASARCFQPIADRRHFAEQNGVTTGFDLMLTNVNRLVTGSGVCGWLHAVDDVLQRRERRKAIERRRTWRSVGQIREAPDVFEHRSAQQVQHGDVSLVRAERVGEAGSDLAHAEDGYKERDVAQNRCPHGRRYSIEGKLQHDYICHGLWSMTWLVVHAVVHSKAYALWHGLCSIT